MIGAVTPDDSAPAPRAASFRPRPVSFVRRSGRMSPAQERAWTELSATYLLSFERDAAQTSIRPGSQIDPAVIWGRQAPLIAEIGSGQGHAIVHAARTRPDVDFLAIEVFRAGLARTMLDADNAGARNLRLAEANAPEVLEHLLPAASLDELWVFFPDPWHKKKHGKRRLVTAEFAQLAASALRVDGVLRLATDWQDYADQMRDVLDRAPGFERAFAGDWAPRYDGRVLTAFERKGERAGRDIRDLTYRRTGP